MRELASQIDAELHDIGGDGLEALLDPGSYGVLQAFARQLRAEHSNGVIYPSVRNPGGRCIAAFWPDAPAIPVQARHFRYHWDGERIDMIQELTMDGSGKVYRLEE